jgi:hypothetical protein
VIITIIPPKANIALSIDIGNSVIQLVDDFNDAIIRRPDHVVR